MAKRIAEIVTSKAFEKKASRLSSKSSYTYGVPSSLYQASAANKTPTKKK
jgi:hypothetical protein